MLKIDSTSRQSPREQIADYFRYEISVGRQFKVGDVLPSTRVVASQAGVSYHTVRGAYKVLEAEGLVSSTSGSGFKVIARSAMDPTERLEQGAALVSDTIKRLFALGLSESDIEYIVEEQIGLLPLSQNEFKVVVVGTYSEFGIQIAKVLKEDLLINVENCLVSEIEQHADAEYVILPVNLFRDLGFTLTHSEIITVDTYLPVDALEAVAKLLDYESLGLLTRNPDSIGPLTKMIKASTGFQGQIIASSTNATYGKRVDTFVSQVDVLLYTPSTRRTVSRHVEKDTPTFSIEEMLTTESLVRIRQGLPS